MTYCTFSAFQINAEPQSSVNTLKNTCIIRLVLPSESYLGLYSTVSILDTHFSRFIVGCLVFTVKKLSRLVVASAVSPLCPDRYECRAIELYRFNCIKGVLTMPSCIRDDFVYEVLKKIYSSIILSSLH